MKRGGGAPAAVFLIMVGLRCWRYRGDVFQRVRGREDKNAAAKKKKKGPLYFLVVRRTDNFNFIILT